jgi:hypothetical protein
MNDLMRYPFGTISKSFYSGLPFRLFMVYLLLSPPPTRLIHIKDKERRPVGESEKTKIREGGAKDINKPNGNPE